MRRKRTLLQEKSKLYSDLSFSLFFKYAGVWVDGFRLSIKCSAEEQPAQ